jgi:hypothetical protein
VRSEGTVSCEPAPRGHIENSVHENFQEKMFGPFRSFQPQADGASKAAKDSARELLKHLPGVRVCEKPFTGSSLALRP